MYAEVQAVLDRFLLIYRLLSHLIDTPRSQENAASGSSRAIALSAASSPWGSTGNVGSSQCVADTVLPFRMCAHKAASHGNRRSYLDGELACATAVEGHTSGETVNRHVGDEHHLDESR